MDLPPPLRARNDYHHFNTDSNHSQSPELAFIAVDSIIIITIIFAASITFTIVTYITTSFSIIINSLLVSRSAEEVSTLWTVKKMNNNNNNYKKVSTL